MGLNFFSGANVWILMNVCTTIDERDNVSRKVFSDFINYSYIDSKEMPPRHSVIKLVARYGKDDENINPSLDAWEMKFHAIKTAKFDACISQATNWPKELEK